MATKKTALKFVKYNGIRQTIEQNRNEITITYNDECKTIIEVPNHSPITLEKWNHLLLNRNKIIHEVKFKK